LRVLLNRAGAITQNGGSKIQGFYGGNPADNGGSALQFVIRNVKDEKFFAGLCHANVVSVAKHHNTLLRLPPGLGLASGLNCINNAISVRSDFDVDQICHDAVIALVPRI
jgi:hypothetical protein